MSALAGVSRWVPEQVKGFIDYYRFPEWRHAWGGPFNGQTCRKAIFQMIVSEVGIATVIETGTYRGTTTELFRSTVGNVISIEGNPRNYGFARARFLGARNVKLLQGDSRDRLRDVFDGRVVGSVAEPLFCYLDAHWNDDLPLAEELEIVFSRRPTAIVMIDDFQVPGDTGYCYDYYGPGKMLTADYVTRAVRKFGLAAAYPSAPSDEETGAKRGCVILARVSRWWDRLLATGLLRIP